MNGLFKTAFNGQYPYAELVKTLSGKPLKKSKRVFDTSKVTDHHAIIPTGVPPRGLTDDEQKVFDLVARRFIAAFYPDCKFATTTVLGKVEDIEFKASGKLITDQGWRVVYAEQNTADTQEKNISPQEITAESNSEERTLPDFAKGESGAHTPTLTEKITTPPKHYTEASLLRAMETAGKFVDDDELRSAMKENGIGRPSSRAGIIETLFKRNYIKREKKNLVATPTGIELIDIIHEELLKSPELTGIWEKRLRDIEHGKGSPEEFINGLKEQVTQIVKQVIADNTNRHVTAAPAADEKKQSPKGDKKTSETTNKRFRAGMKCPLCGKGKIIKGKTAYGCSRWNDAQEPCLFRKPF